MKTFVIVHDKKLLTLNLWRIVQVFNFIWKCDEKIRRSYVEGFYFRRNLKRKHRNWSHRSYRVFYADCFKHLHYCEQVDPWVEIKSCLELSFEWITNWFLLYWVLYWGKFRFHIYNSNDLIWACKHFKHNEWSKIKRITKKNRNTLKLRRNYMKVIWKCYSLWETNFYV